MPKPSELSKKDIFTKKRNVDQADLATTSEKTPVDKKTKFSCCMFHKITILIPIATCGVECSALRYHSTKMAGYQVCAPCYTEGRFPSTLFSGDFIKMKPTEKDDWNDQDTLLLLEGIEMFDDDWSKIALHVGKSKDECVLRFLKVFYLVSSFNT